jgi:hypothetical protein
MKQVQERPSTTRSAPSAPAGRGVGTPLPLWRLNVLRGGYLLMGGGLAVVKWPLLLDRGSWGLEEGTIVTLLVGMSVLALLGLRHPERMLPILMFEVTWKLLWLGLVAVPLWLDGTLQGDMLEQTATILWVVPIIVVVPWRYVVRQYVTGPGTAWRRRG